ncbi:MAG: sugar-binding protein [Spirochaetota bacterium]|mgnify:CR=1 FL=1
MVRSNALIMCALFAAAVYGQRTVAASITLANGDGAVSVPNAADINPGSGDFMISFRMKAADQAKAHIVSKAGWAYNSYSAYIEGGKFHVELKLPNPPGKGFRLSVPVSSVLDNAWHDIRASFIRAGKCTFTIDGKIVDSKDMTDSGIAVVNEAPLIIGKGPAGGFTGELADVKVHAGYAPAAGSKKPEGAGDGAAKERHGSAPGGTIRMNDNGAFTIVDKEVMIKDGILYYIVNGTEIFNVRIIWSAPGLAYGQSDVGTLTNARMIADRREHIITGKIVNKDGTFTSGGFEIRVALADDGIISYHARIIDPEGKISATVRIIFPKFILDNTIYKDGDEAVTLGTTYGKENNRAYKSKVIDLFSGDVDRNVKLGFLESGGTDFVDRRGETASPYGDIRMRVAPSKEARLSIDIRNVDEKKLSAYRSRIVNEFDPLDFEKFNLAKLPNYAASLNRIQNPSFEEGFHSWEVRQWATVVGDTNHAEECIIIDDRTAYHGKKSLRYQLRRGSIPNPTRAYQPLSSLSTFPYQFKAGRQYTLSFYAKAEEASANAGLMFITKTWGKWMHTKNFSLTTEWKRYVTTFTPAETAGQLFLNVSEGGIKGERVHIWIDAVQLEESSADTPFTMKPIAVSMERTRNLQFVRDPKKMVFDLVNMTASPRSTDARVIIRDLFKNEIFSREWKSVSLSPGAPSPLAFDVASVMDHIGFYTIEVRLSGSEHNDYDFFRIAVIDPYSKDDMKSMKHNLVFSWGLFPSCNWPKNVALMRMLGTGGVEANNFTHCAKEIQDVFDREGMIVFGMMIDDGANARYMPDQDRIMKLLHTITDYDGPEMDEITAWFKNYFRQTKHFKFWKYANEPNLGIFDKPSIYNPKTFPQIMKRLYAVLKEEIPDAVVISPDPANNFDSARKWLDVLLESGGGRYFDILATHPYREKPERPSLEYDSEEFIKLADKHGFKGDLWYSEGGNWSQLYLPAIPVGRAFANTDSVRLGRFTSDVYGNRYCAAYNLRTMIITLRYADRIKMFLNWTTGGVYIDSVAGIPTDIGVGYNAVARMLGNSSFVRDFKYAETVKTFLFNNGSGAGVAAIWDFDDKLELAERSPLKFRLKNVNGITVTDVLGRPLAAEKKGEYLVFSIDYMPAFICGLPVKELEAVLTASTVEYGEKEAISISPKIIDHRTLSLMVKNKDAKPFTGTFTYAVNGNEASAPLAIGGLSERAFTVDLAPYISQSARYTIDVKGKVHTDRTLSERTERMNILFCSRTRGNIVIDGELDDWADYRYAVVGGTEDDAIDYRTGGGSYKAGAAYRADPLKAKFMFAYDDANLYMAVIVKDDVHYQPFPATKFWAADSIQLFIDAFKDGTENSLNMQDDYAYMLGSGVDGDQVFRNFSPQRQIAWLDNVVVEKGVPMKIKRDEEKKMTTYELCFPAKYINPVSIKKNSVIGLGLMVNDADENKSDPNIPRKTAVTTCNGKEGWMNPWNLSYFVFE